MLNVDMEKVKSVSKAGLGGASIVTIFLMLHGDIKAEIKSALNRIGVTEKKVIKLETQEEERNNRFLKAVERFENKLDTIETKIDKLK